MAQAVSAAGIGKSLSAIIVLKASETKFFNLHGFRICGARNCKHLFCGRLGRCPFHSIESTLNGASEEPKSIETVHEDSYEEVVRPSAEAPENDMASAAPSFGSRTEPYTSFTDKRDAQARPTLEPAEVNPSGQSRGADVLSDTELQRAFEDGVASIRIAGSRERPEEELDGQAALSFWERWRATNQTEQRTKRARFKRAWSLQEHARFLEALTLYGKGKWKDIAAYVGTRSAAQCQSHAQKFFGRAEVQLRMQSAADATEAPAIPASKVRTLCKRSIHDIRDPNLIRSELARQEDERRARAERHARRAAARQRKLLDTNASLIETRLRDHLERFVQAHASMPPRKRLVSNMRRSVQKCTQEWKTCRLMEAFNDASTADGRPAATASDDEHIPVVFMVPEESLPVDAKVFHLRKPVALAGIHHPAGDTLE